MKKNSKKVLKAVKTLGKYCGERTCTNCMFVRANGCILSLRDVNEYGELAKDLKKLLERRPEE